MSINKNENTKEKNEKAIQNKTKEEKKERAKGRAWTSTRAHEKRSLT